ncbi:MAG: hypothetical protein P4L84_25275 [Isosphaeraceae bacterium]|nr:hypothetical protein [Isosphaeraceae bacterium]
MAAQRVTIAKVGGVAANFIMGRLQGWAAARLTRDPHEWDAEQWPKHVRREVDAFADGLRAHALVPPVVHFVEWSDLWSMGDVLDRLDHPAKRAETVQASRRSV